MNWYIQYKQAQIWEPESDYQTDPDISEMVIHIFKLQYARDMLLEKPFSGHPKRKQSILDHIDGELQNVLEDIKHILQGTFEVWLNNHALTNASDWGRMRAIGPSYQDFEEMIMSAGNAEYVLSTIVKEIVQLRNNNELPDAYIYKPGLFESDWNKIVYQEIMPNIEDFPAFAGAFSQDIEAEKEYRREELRANGVEEYNSDWGTEYQTDEQAEADIDQMDVSYTIENVVDNHSLAELSQMLYDTGYLESIAQELNEKLVFPLWYAHWAPQGIEGTRANVEKAYQSLENINPDNIRSSLEIIQLALQTAHQNGEMTDYIDQYSGATDYGGIKETLTTLTGKDNPYIAEWNEELRQIGVQI